MDGDTPIGIVGAGALGKALARRAARADIRVVICHSRAPALLAGFAASAGGSIAPVTFAEAVEPEIVVLALPFARVAIAADRVVDWEGRIVIDATNPEQLLPVDEPRSSSEIVAGLLPGAQVVKAFNTLPASTIADASAVGQRVMFQAGDHARAKAVVARLIEKLGFAAIDLGGLAEGGRLMQPGGVFAGVELVRL